MLQVFEQLQFSVGSLGEHRGAERLHDLLDGDILAGELVSGGAVCRGSLLAPFRMSGLGKLRVECPYQTKPNAPMPTGWRSEYLEVISKVVPKIWARTNSAMTGAGSE